MTLHASSFSGLQPGHGRVLPQTAVYTQLLPQLVYYKGYDLSYFLIQRSAAWAWRDIAAVGGL